MKNESPVTLSLSLEDRLAIEAFILGDQEKKKADARAVRFSLLEMIELTREERKMYFRDLGNGTALADSAAIEAAAPLAVSLNGLEQEELERLCDTPASARDNRWQRSVGRMLKRAQEAAKAGV